MSLGHNSITTAKPREDYSAQHRRKSHSSSFTIAFSSYHETLYFSALSTSTHASSHTYLQRNSTLKAICFCKYCYLRFNALWDHQTEKKRRRKWSFCASKINLRNKMTQEATQYESLYGLKCLKSSLKKLHITRQFDRDYNSFSRFPASYFALFSTTIWPSTSYLKGEKRAYFERNLFAFQIRKSTESFC